MSTCVYEYTNILGNTFSGTNKLLSKKQKKIKKTINTEYNPFQRHFLNTHTHIYTYPPTHAFTYR